MTATVILNPYSNRWEAGRRAPEIEQSLQRSGIEYIMQKTERPKHGTELAQLAVEQGNLPIIAVGGDGTVTEVVNGILQATMAEKRPAGPLGIIPFGTANDLTDVLGIPREIDKAVDIIKADHTQDIDVGRVNGHFFDNNSAIGLEPMVTMENIRLTWLRGVIRYLVSAIITILKRPTWEAQMKWDTGEYEGSITLVSVGNTCRTGGVFYMTPNASYNDGYLDFIFAPSLSRLRLFQLLPKSQTGEHINEPEVMEHRTRRLSIRTKTPTAIQADGELISTNSTEINYEVVPKALKIFTKDQSTN